MNQGITLYHYWRSSSSWRVRWGLEIKGVKHVKVPVNILGAEEKLPGYVAKNPSGYLPCLVVEGHQPLGESIAILEWLEETFPQPSFFSGDAFERALIRQLAETVNSGTQPLQNPDVSKLHSPDKDEQTRWMKHWIERGLGVFETLLEKDGRRTKFSVSGQPSLADLCLIPQVYAANRFGVDMDKFPRCRDIYAHAMTEPSCIASHPDRFKPAP